MFLSTYTRDISAHIFTIDWADERPLEASSKGLRETQRPVKTPDGHCHVNPCLKTALLAISLHYILVTAHQDKN